jgi:hypothetical protein
MCMQAFSWVFVLTLVCAEGQLTPYARDHIVNPDRFLTAMEIRWRAIGRGWW